MNIFKNEQPIEMNRLTPILLWESVSAVENATDLTILCARVLLVYVNTVRDSPYKGQYPVYMNGQRERESERE